MTRKEFITMKTFIEIIKSHEELEYCFDKTESMLNEYDDVFGGVIESYEKTTIKEDLLSDFTDNCEELCTRLEKLYAKLIFFAVTVEDYDLYERMIDSCRENLYKYTTFKEKEEYTALLSPLWIMFHDTYMSNDYIDTFINVED